MRLLHVRTKHLKEFFGDRIPPYAILSHTWGEEEVTFQDLQHPSHKKKRGYTKIEQTCRLAAEKFLSWTMTEIHEAHKTAINSMFSWYEGARVCFVFLEDVPPLKSGPNIDAAMRNARWLTRGWTLQEFIAPAQIELFNSAWEIMTYNNFAPTDFPTINWGSNMDFGSLVIQHFTGIVKKSWKYVDLPVILSWAARRKTSRLEDMAYCLFGLLGVNMPLLYGEGSNAFPRLLEEVIKKSNSHGVLAAWYGLPNFIPQPDHLSLFPQSPSPYRGCSGGFRTAVVPGKPSSPHFSLTNAGLSIELPLILIDHEHKVALGLLNCQDESKPDTLIAIVLAQRTSGLYGHFYHQASQPLSVPIDFHGKAERENIYITRTPAALVRSKFQLSYDCLHVLGYKFGGVYPPCKVESLGTRSLVLSTDRITQFILLFTVPDERPNLVIFFPLGSAKLPPTPLMSLTESVSVIEFLLLKKLYRKHNNSTPKPLVLEAIHSPGYTAVSSIWSNQIDLHQLLVLDLWLVGVVTRALGSQNSWSKLKVDVELSEGPDFNSMTAVISESYFV